MPLSPPAPRQHLHTRSVTYGGYLRDDGLWDIEGEISDTKTYGFEMPGRGPMPPGSRIHGMLIRVTVDESMTVRVIEAVMDDAPYGECRRGEEPLQRMVGASMGPGWRQAIERALGGTKGCTHLRELLFNMATAAYQTIFPYREHERQIAGTPSTVSEQPPYHLGRCIAWDVDGPIVESLYPQFSGWAPLRRKY